jgi:hypothetical protein
MTKADERRLAKIEAALSPKQAFLLWLEEAREHGSLAALVVSMKGQPIEEHPYQRLPRRVEQAVRERSKTETTRSTSASRAQRYRQIEAEVTTAIREVAFYYELHVAITARVSAEKRALALQTLLALDVNRDLMFEKEPSQEDIDKTHHWVVQSAGDLLVLESLAKRLANQYTDEASCSLTRSGCWRDRSRRP